MHFNAHKTNGVQTQSLLIHGSHRDQMTYFDETGWHQIFNMPTPRKHPIKRLNCEVPIFDLRGVVGRIKWIVYLLTKYLSLLELN